MKTIRLFLMALLLTHCSKENFVREHNDEINLAEIASNIGTEEIVHYKELQTRNDLKYTPNTDLPFNGLTERRDKDGIPEVVRFKDGLPNGEAVKFHYNGQISRVQTYKDGILHGWTNQYLDNGQILSKVQYELGEPAYVEGYYLSGKLKVQYNPRGEGVNFYENGNIKIKEKYDREGTKISFEEYDETGNLIKRE